MIFSDQEVSNLNDYQDAGIMHPFTCGGSHPGPSPSLVATNEGWICPEGCGYTQDWAHDWMKDGSWRVVAVWRYKRD